MKAKKITAVALAAAVMAATAVTASAVDSIGSFYDISLTLGQKHSDTIPLETKGYFNYFEYNDGKDYRDYRVKAPADGTMVLIYDAEIDKSEIWVYDADTKESIDTTKTTVTGSQGSGCEWDSTAGVYAGAIQFKVEADTEYFLRVARARLGYLGGEKGSGKINITPNMKKPGDANNDDKINAMDATAVLKHVADIKKLKGIDMINADANGDGKINAMDATAILKHVADIEKLPNA